FDTINCLSFDDPAEVQGVEEDNRVRLWAQFNIVDPDRQWFPGQPVNLGAASGASVNTPSIRGVWWGTDYLRHGYADDIREAILAPGHPALDINGDGQLDEQGFAYASPTFPKDVHGITSGLNSDQVRNLILYVRSIPAESTLDNPFYE
ncbi:MAG TPA: hypothetical protein VFG83_07200, partial [Kofleriaceae bacterium]|nr:hypothetical protein [Kofleriaceae bacterium]